MGSTEYFSQSRLFSGDVCGRLSASWREQKPALTERISGAFHPPADKLREFLDHSFYRYMNLFAEYHESTQPVPAGTDMRAAIVRKEQARKAIVDATVAMNSELSELCGSRKVDRLTGMLIKICQRTFNSIAVPVGEARTMTLVPRGTLGEWRSVGGRA